MDSHLEVIDAFVDGERVDIAALKAALSESDGRDYFADAWLLREGVQQDTVRGSEVPGFRGSEVGRTYSRGFRDWMIAAALVAGMGIGYFGGYRAPLRSTTPTVPAPTAVNNVATPVRSSFPAPAPTRVIQVEFQPDGARNGGD